MPNVKPRTAEQLHVTIREIFAKRAIGAQQSQYDRSVCILAIAKADHEEIGENLKPVFADYNDPDGEHTSGKSSIGDVYFDILSVLKSW